MITDRAFRNFLNCPREAFLQASGDLGDQPDIERVQLELDSLYRRAALDTFLGVCDPSDFVVDPPAWSAVSGAARIAVNVTVTHLDLQAQLHAAERVERKGGQRTAIYAPVLFLRADKPTRFDKLVLAFQVFVLASVQGAKPPVAKLVHGEGQKVLKLKVEPLLGEVQNLVAKMRLEQAQSNAPRVTLNAHCTVCEFRAACRQSAQSADDLSLLRGMSVKEVEKHRSRGITTVMQFSHTYRPGRRGKRLTEKARRHDLALQALAIREKKVHVVDCPPLPSSGTALYLDVEGVPDQGFYYLIGLIAVQDGVCKSHSFWADNRGQEKSNWDACAQVIEGFGDYTLYHYGSYELGFLDRMKKAADMNGAAAVDRIRARSCNILAAIYSHFYFPTYSNSLKEIGSLLGVKWSADNASGIQSVAWRLAWELSGDESFKQELLRYNQEDCFALRRVTEFLQAASGGASGSFGDGGPALASADDLPQANGFRFGKTEFFCPELAFINKRAYSDYQREKVYVRTSPALRKSLRRAQRAGKRKPKVNEEVECKRPRTCPQCGGRRVQGTGPRRAYKVVSDLKHTSSGVKRWVVRYSSLRFRCAECKKTFYAYPYGGARHHFGNELCAWVIYQHIALRLTHEDVNLSLNDIFGFPYVHKVLARIKPIMAEQHQVTNEKLKEKLRRGPLIHVDETKVLVKGHTGYVWAFTNLEEVVYVYTPTREGAILDEMLAGFTGVLVSDFYSAYDAPKCPQQKCLIHLSRDINDDLFHSPFDEELKQLAQGLVGILKPIIDTIDRYGLKRHYLHKHKDDVDRFFRHLTGQAYESDAARKYQKRFLKYRDKLFVFLDHDGVPWNNNNAENAIKRFASRRKIIGASFTEKGLRDYLVFLSIYQTCRHKSVSFLRFLRSGGFDLDAFAEASH